MAARSSHHQHQHHHIEDGVVIAEAH